MLDAAAFFETSSLILGLVKDNAHRISTSQSSLFRAFVFLPTSAENLFSNIFVAENGSRILIVTLL